MNIYYELTNPDSEAKNTTSPAANNPWAEVYTSLKTEIQVRHYTRRTLETYSKWVKNFQKFTNSKELSTLSTADVKDYLTFLGVKCTVSASTQNLAFNSLLFFFRHILNKDFGDTKDVVRVKRKKYIPVVLSREEVDAVLENLTHPYDLVVKLLYCCGLRLFECLNLRVSCFNFDAMILTVHLGGENSFSHPLMAKGKKTALSRCLI